MPTVDSIGTGLPFYLQHFVLLFINIAVVACSNTAICSSSSETLFIHRILQLLLLYFKSIIYNSKLLLPKYSEQHTALYTSASYQDNIIALLLSFRWEFLSILITLKDILMKNSLYNFY